MVDPVFVSGTDPYPWPYDGRLDPARLAFVVCGAQRRFVDASLGVEAVAARVAAAAAAVRRSGGTVVWVRHGGHAGPRRPPGWLPERCSAEWALTEVPDPGDLVVDAPGWDGTFSSDLDHSLRSAQRSQVVLAGFAAEATVDSTVRTLNDRGYECLVLHDACAPLDGELGARALHSLTMSGGIFGAHGASAALLDALESLRERSLV